MGNIAKYTRPDGSKALGSFELQSKSGNFAATEFLDFTLPAAANILAGLGTKSYTDPVSGDTVICSGTIVVLPSGYGITVQDTEESTEGPVVTEHPCYMVLLASGAAPAAGNTAYIIPETDAAEGQITESAAGNTAIGHFVKYEGNLTVTNPTNMPAGTYGYVYFKGL